MQLCVMFAYTLTSLQYVLLTHAQQINPLMSQQGMLGVVFLFDIKSKVAESI